MTGCDILQPGAEVFDFHSPSAESSGVSGARHVTDAVHSALQWKNSGLKPGGHEISWQETFSFQLGDPSDLSVNIAITEHHTSATIGISQSSVRGRTRAGS